MDIKTAESRANKRLLIWPWPILPEVQVLFTMIFMNIVELVKYITEVLSETDTFHLVIQLGCFNDLKDDLIYRFPQVTRIDVICNTVRNVKWAKRRFPSEHEKLQFCTIYDLLRSWKSAEVDRALGSSNSIDQRTIDAIISSIEASVTAKRSDIFTRRSQIIVRELASTKLYGFPAKNISDFNPCSSCKLFYGQVCLLKCEHKQCEVCVNIQKWCKMCSKVVLRDRVRMITPDVYPCFFLPLCTYFKVILNQNLFTHCSHCDWVQPWTHYEKHLKQNHHELITCFIHNQQVDEKIFHQEFFVNNQPSSDPNIAVSLNGTAIWEISDFCDNKNDAAIDEPKSIYSTPFYLFPNGYKMRLQLFLNGDSSARGTHMSLFVVLMRGDHDKYLYWPFHFKVTFTLLNQLQTNNNQSRSFWSDTRSICFRQPCADMNIPYGISKCFPLDILKKNENYFVRDDTLLIKVEVDFLAKKPEIPFHDDGNESINDREQGDAMDDDISAMICPFDNSNNAQQSS